MSLLATETPALPATETAPSPARTPAAPSPSAPASPVAPVDGKAQERSDARRARLRDMDAKAGKPATNPTPAEPAKAPEAAAKAPAVEPAKADDEKAERYKSIKVPVFDDEGKIAVDKEGKAKEEEISYDQARNAVLREKGGAKLLKGMSKSDVLEIGSQWLLEQRKRDGFGNRFAQSQRELADLRAQRAGTSPSQAATPAVPVPQGQPADPAQRPASPAPSNPLVNAPTPTPSVAQPKWEAKLEGVRQTFGDDGANVFKELVSAALEEVTGNYQQQQAKYEEATKKAEAQVAHLHNLHIERLFSAERREQRDNFPQLKTDAAAAKVQKAAIALSQSGQWEDPLASFPEVYAAACQACFGAEQAETHALQLAEAAKRQREGNPTTGHTRKNNSQPEALSRRDRLRAIERGDADKALATQTG